MKRTVTILFITAALIYGLQLLIFKDPTNTGFYIFQDFAFLPISIAVATIVVGEFLDQKEKKERREKTQMLTSTFFTELGTGLMIQLLLNTENAREIREIMSENEVTNQKELQHVQGLLRQVKLKVSLTPELFEKIRTMILNSKETLLIFTSNPMVLDHEDFTDLLWGIFHLIDEFQLRGEYDELDKADIAHMEADCAEVLSLLLVNWAANGLYTKLNYPNYYNAALGKLTEYGKSRAREK